MAEKTKKKTAQTSGTISRKEMFRKIVSYYKPHKGMFGLDMLCSFLVAVCDLFYPQIAKNIINDYVYRDTTRFIIVWALAMLAIYLIKAGLNFYIQYWGHVVGVYIQGDMRRDLFRHIQKLPFKYFDENKTGTIMSRLVNDLMEITELAHHGPENLLISTIMLIGSFILLFRINWILTLIIFIFIPFIVLYAVKLQRNMSRAFMQSRVEIGEVNSSLETSISGIRVSRAYTSEDHEMSKFEESNHRFIKARKFSYKMMSLFHTGTSLLMDLLYLVALVAGGLFLFYKKINAGDFTAFLLYVNFFLKPINNLINIFEQIQDGLTGIRRFNEIMSVEEEKDEPGAVDVGQLKGNIEFHDVTFTYETTDQTGAVNTDPKYNKPVISHLSMSIPQGETLALVGPSGGGKTTLCHLIPRFYEVDSGTITIDGIDIKHMTRESLRRNIGMVAQDVYLFNGTIRENIAYGNLDATDDEIVEAAKKANIHDYIMQMPDGYDTNVGERGVKLSGGQKQRISIARVFLKNPSILILDEATSALDNATEMLIQQSLEELSKGRTCLIVAHRLSTIKNADEIIVINDHGIQERGTHDQLLAKNGIYADLYQYQFRV